MVDATLISGVNFLIKVNTGTESAPVWTIVGGQRNATLNKSTETIDVTSKDSGGWTESIPGRRSWSIEFDGLLILGDAALEALQTAWEQGQQVLVQYTTPDGRAETGLATLTALNIEAGHGGPATAKGTLTGTGAIVRQ